jgi:antitoxin PrlF
MKNANPNAPGRRRGEAQPALADRSPAHLAGHANSEIGNFSRVTERAQTTVPKGVRNALGAGPGSTLCWIIQGDVAVVSVQESEQADPVINAFLAFLQQDMMQHPEQLSAFPAEMIERGRALTAGVTFNLDEPLE